MGGWALVLVGCGAAQTAQPYLEVFPTTPTLIDGHVHRAVQVLTPPGARSADCRLVMRWEGPATQGEIGPIAPESTSARDAFFRVVVDVGTSDVVRTEGRVTCGALAHDVYADWAGTSEADARYCGLCPPSPPAPPIPARELSHPGIEVFPRVGTSLDVRGTAIVDRCTGRTLVELGDVVTSLRGGRERWSELALLHAADHGEDVCARPQAAPGILIELSDDEVAGVATRLRGIEGIGVVLSIPLMPG